MTATAAQLDVLAVGEIMGLFDPASEGPLEDAGQFTLRVAGAEGNALIALSRLGHQTGLVSAVGDDPVGRLVLRTLAAQGVRTEHVAVSADHPTGLFLKERFPDGIRRVYYYRRGSAAGHLAASDARFDQFADPRVLLASGLTLGLGEADGLGAAARSAIIHFSRRNVSIVFDANVRKDLWDGARAARDFADLRPAIDVLLAGEEELSVLVPDFSPEAAAVSLCAHGMRAVVVKQGADGAVVHQAGTFERIQAVPVAHVVDPVGAGDAFAAGLISGLLHGWSVADSARLGAALGARAVTVSGDWEAIPADRSPEAMLAEYHRAVEVGRAAADTADSRVNVEVE